MSGNKELIERLRSVHRFTLDELSNEAADALEAAEATIALLEDDASKMTEIHETLLKKIEVTEQMASEVSYLLRWSEDYGLLPTSTEDELLAALKAWEELQK